MARQAPVSEYQSNRVPLVGIFNTREFDATDNTVSGGTSGTVGLGIVGEMIVGNQQTVSRDQRWINCFPTKLENPFSENATFYLVKRPGFVEHSEPSTGNPGKYILYWGNREAGAAIVSAFGDTNSDIFVDTTNIGTITGECSFLLEIIINTTAAFVIQSTDNTLWYYVEDMVATVDGDTNTSTTITNVADTTGIWAGQLITGTDIPADTRVVSTTASTIVIDTAATGSTASVTFTLETIAVVDDVDYPGNPAIGKTIKPGCASLNGYLYIMDNDGIIYNSDLNSLSSWTADGSIQTQQYPDRGISVMRYRNLIAGFNTTSVEFFSDVGNPSGTPLLNNTQATIKIGAANPYGIASVEDILAWVSSTDQGGSAVYLYDNYQPTKISTPIIEQQIAYVGATNVKVDVAKFFGRTFIFVILEANTYVYCVEDTAWHEWSSSEAYWDFITVAYMGLNHIYTISTHDTLGVRGKIWKLDAANVRYQDDDSDYTVTIQTSKIDLGNDSRKKLTRLKVIGDTKSASADISVSWSDDDYKTFSSPRTVDIMNDYKYISNCGSFRRRAFKLVYIGAVGMRLEALELNTTQGVN